MHFVFLLFVIFGLPEFLSARPPEEPQAITVELLPITGVTNVKPSEKPPAPEEKQDEKSKPKASPPVKTAEFTPPPPEKESPDKAKEKKKEEKKPEPKKEEKKPEKKKPKEDDLAAVLKAVKETAQKEEKKNDKEDNAKSKSRSNQYDPTLPLSLSEKDAIRGQIAKCWNVPAGAKDAQDLIVVLDLELAQDGTVIKVELANESKGRYSRDTFFRAAADSAIRAVHQCSPLKDLPPDKYSTWHEMELTFDPKEMLL
jgi:hypothetical protein